MFNIEQSEYVADVSEKAGVRVLIHHAGEMAFPEDGGIDILPGRLTSIGLKEVSYFTFGAFILRGFLLRLSPSPVATNNILFKFC